MIKYNVLIFPSCSEVGLASYECLKNHKNFFVIGGSNDGKISKNIFENLITGIPYVDSPNFLEYFNKIIHEYKIDVILPCNDIVALELSKNQDKINAKIAGSSYLTNQIAFSKKKTYEILSGIIKTPKIFDYNQINSHDFPLFLKPDNGHSAINTNKVCNFEELDFYFKKTKDLIILDFLPGEEYTIDCFTDNEGILRYCKSRIRVSVKSGMSVNTRFVENNDVFIEIAKKINEKFQFNGGWFFQVKLNNLNIPVLLEISTRLAGNSNASLLNGVNFPLLNIYNSLNQKIDIIDNDFVIEMSKINVSKYILKKNDFKTLYIDLDDTIILNEIVNLDAIKLLYHCFNAKKEIILITRHKFDISKTLEKFKIPNLFSSIIHIKDNKPKSFFIDKNKIKDSIFIDDSFAERVDVAKKGVITYGIEMISYLI
jgi:hypothetical protein